MSEESFVINLENVKQSLLDMPEGLVREFLPAALEAAPAANHPKASHSRAGKTGDKKRLKGTRKHRKETRKEKEQEARVRSFLMSQISR